MIEIKKVYVVTYWDGFIDSGLTQVCICSSKKVANLEMQKDMRSRDTSYDRIGLFEWEVYEHDLIEDEL